MHGFRTHMNAVLPAYAMLVCPRDPRARSSWEYGAVGRGPAGCRQRVASAADPPLLLRPAVPDGGVPILPAGPLPLRQQLQERASAECARRQRVWAGVGVRRRRQRAWGVWRTAATSLFVRVWQCLVARPRARRARDCAYRGWDRVGPWSAWPPAVEAHVVRSGAGRAKLDRWARYESGRGPCDGLPGAAEWPGRCLHAARAAATVECGCCVPAHRVESWGGSAAGAAESAERQAGRRWSSAQRAWQQRIWRRRLGCVWRGCECVWRRSARGVRRLVQCLWLWLRPQRVWRTATGGLGVCPARDTRRLGVWAAGEACVRIWTAFYAGRLGVRAAVNAGRFGVWADFRPWRLGVRPAFDARPPCGVWADVRPGRLGVRADGQAWRLGVWADVCTGGFGLRTDLHTGPALGVRPVARAGSIDIWADICARCVRVWADLHAGPALSVRADLHAGPALGIRADLDARRRVWHTLGVRGPEHRWRRRVWAAFGIWAVARAGRFGIRADSQARGLGIRADLCTGRFGVRADVDAREAADIWTALGSGTGGCVRAAGCGWLGVWAAGRADGICAKRRLGVWAASPFGIWADGTAKRAGAWRLGVWPPACARRAGTDRGSVCQLSCGRERAAQGCALRVPGRPV